MAEATGDQMIMTCSCSHGRPIPGECPACEKMFEAETRKRDEEVRDRAVERIIPRTLRDIIQQEGLTHAQAQHVRNGLRWAQIFGLIRHPHWKRYRFNVGDLQTSLVLSVIIEAARRIK